MIAYLPTNSCLTIHSFGLSFFGDETMGETTRGAHISSSKIMLTQEKDDSTMVPVVMEAAENNHFTVPNG